MAPKISCAADLCSHNADGDCAATKIAIDEDGVCKNYTDEDEDDED